DVADRVGRGDVGERGYQHLVPRAHVQGEQGQVQGHRAVADGDGGVRGAQGRELALEAVQVGAGGGDPGTPDRVHDVRLFVPGQVRTGDGNLVGHGPALRKGSAPPATGVNLVGKRGRRDGLIGRRDEGASGSGQAGPSAL